MDLRLLPELFHDSILRWHKRDHYEYQKRIARLILEALVAANRGEAVIEIPIEFPRQSGKTTTVVDLVEFLLSVFRRLFGRPLRVGIFAPQIEQATTDFDRLKTQFSEIARLGFKSKATMEFDVKIPEKWNSKTIKLYSKNNVLLGEVYIFPISKHSNPESKTLDLIIVEEAQDVDDDRMKNAVFPMGVSTNAPRIYIGTAGTRLCYFKSQLDNNPRAIVTPLESVLADRQKRFEETQIIDHLHYKNYVDHEIEREGITSDYIQRQYFLVWKIGSGQFTTPEILEALTGSFDPASSNGPVYELDDKGEPKKDRRGELIVKKEAPPCYAGIDTAKSPDQTVCTVIKDSDDPALIEFAKAAKEKIAQILAKEESMGNAVIGGVITAGEIKAGSVGMMCSWLSIRGTNYVDQAEILKKHLQKFENLRAVAIDSTGQGDFMPDWFERNTSWNIIRVKFGAETKDVLYKNLDQVQKNALTLLPNCPMDSNYRQFKKEMIELLKEYRGRFLTCHHPEKDADGKPGHDDFPDSWALAEYAKTESKKKEPGLIFV